MTNSQCWSNVSFSGPQFVTISSIQSKMEHRPGRGKNIGFRTFSMNFSNYRKSSLCADEELTTYQQPQLQQNGIDNFGTLESGRSAPTANASTFWPQIVAEVWTEPAKQSSSMAEENGIELSRKAVSKTLFYQIESLC